MSWLLCVPVAKAGRLESMKPCVHLFGWQGVSEIKAMDWSSESPQTTFAQPLATMD